MVNQTGAGLARHLTGTDTGSGFRGSAIFTVPASIAVPIVQVKGSAKFTDSTGSQVIHMAGQMTLSPTGTMCIPGHWLSITCKVRMENW
jgi:hypothetical protein